MCLNDFCILIAFEHLTHKPTHKLNIIRNPSFQSDLMDFHSLNRKDLQSLCKLNKIPANITNIAMADALQSLQIVVGIEEFSKVSPSKTADLGGKVEVPSPKAPNTRCRTSTRQKVKVTETETLRSTVTRTTRRGSKQLPTEVEDSKNNLLQTPAISSRQNVSYRLNECENEAKEDNKYSTRRSTRLTEKKSAAPRVKKEVEKAVEIDSILAVTSKMPEEVPLETEVEDICNAFDKLDVLVMEEEAMQKSDEEDEVNNQKQEPHETSNSCDDSLKISEVITDEVGDAKPELDGISSPAEEATHNNLNKESHETSNSCDDSLKISEVKTDEVSDVKPDSEGNSRPAEEATHNNLNKEFHETSNLFEDEDLKDSMKTSEVKNDLKSDSDDISGPSKDKESLVHKLELGDSFKSAIQEETSDSDDISSPIEDENLEKKLNLEVETFVAVKGADPELGHEDTLCADSEITKESSTMAIDDTENPVDEINTNEIEEKSENKTVDETFDVIPMDSTMTEEAEDLKPMLFTENNVNEKSDAESGPAQNPAHMTPIKNAIQFKNNMLTVVSDDKENIVDKGNVQKKEKDEMRIIKSLNETSIRQLKKQLKALTLKNHNSKAEAAATTRPALQALCENQMVVGAETEN